MHKNEHEDIIDLHSRVSVGAKVIVLMQGAVSIRGVTRPNAAACESAKIRLYAKTGGCDLSTSKLGSRPIQASVMAAVFLLAHANDPGTSGMADELQTAPPTELCRNAVVAQAGGAKGLR